MFRFGEFPGIRFLLQGVGEGFGAGLSVMPDCRGSEAPEGTSLGEAPG